MMRAFHTIAPCLAFALASLAPAAQAQSSMLAASAVFGLPLAPAGLYRAAAGGGLEFRLPLGDRDTEAFARVDFASLLAERRLPGVSTLRLGGGLSFPLLEGGALSLAPTLGLGAYGAYREGSPFLANPAASAGLRLGLGVGRLRLEFEPTAEYLLSFSDGAPATFFSSFGARIGLALAPSRTAVRSRLRIGEPRFEPFLPAIYKRYASTPLGFTVIENRESRTIRDLTVSFFVPAHMDGPQTVATIASMAPGESLELPLAALFRNEVLGITETDSVQFRVEAAYSIGEASAMARRDGVLRLEGRNGIVWDDDRMAAAFVTARDPTILKLARNVHAALPREGLALPSEAFRGAVALFQALEAYGLRYAVDPRGSYVTAKAGTVDYLQFPVETLAYRAGDCDDLSTLYLALLESLGIETAFVTVPGHIYAAFALELDAKAARGVLADPGSWIEDGGRVWIPVETTAIGKGFAEAWATGARQWREASRSGAAALFPTREAWRDFEPTFISSGERADVAARLPDPARVAGQYATTMRGLAERELSALVAGLGAANPAALTAAARNRIGVTYARFGRLDRAETWFREAAAAGNQAATLNLAKSALLRSDWRGALDWYRKALAAQPGNGDAALGLARASHALGDLEGAARAYDKARSLAPDLAAAHAYLAPGGQGSGRASDQAAEAYSGWTE